MAGSPWRPSQSSLKIKTPIVDWLLDTFRFDLCYRKSFLHADLGGKVRVNTSVRTNLAVYHIFLAKPHQNHDSRFCAMAVALDKISRTIACI